MDALHLYQQQWSWRCVGVALPDSEDRQWIERRSCSFFDAQRRSREQKLETIKPPRLLDCSLEIEIIENVYAHRD